MNVVLKLVNETPFSVDQGKLLEPPLTEIWVRGKEDPKQLAKDVFDDISVFGRIDMACIGAAAINQALKAVAIIRGKQPTATIVVVPFFSVISDDKDRERTRMMLRVIYCPPQ